MSYLENVPDYLMLYKVDAVNNGGKYTWNIPSSYYSNQRGQVCYVSLCDCLVDDTGVDEEIAVKYHSGGQNYHSTKNSGAYLGGLSTSVESAGHSHHKYDADRVKLLVSARPTTIELSTVNCNDDLVELDEVIFVLKFEYLNTENTNNQYINTFSKTQI